MPLPRLSRHGSEIPALLVTLAAFAFVVVVLTPLTAGLVLVALAVGFGFQFAMVAFWRWSLRRKAVPVDRYPDLAALAEGCKARLGMGQRVEVLVVDQPVLNAFATGMWAPYTVVLYTGLLRHLGRDEAAFVVGHELGHVKFGHTALLALLGQLHRHSYGIRGLGFLLRLIFLKWSRVAEHSADRAGLVACGDVGAGVRALLTVGMGPDKARTVDVPAMVRHWETHDAGWKDALGAVFSTHPDLSTRLDRMVDWARTGR